MTFQQDIREQQFRNRYMSFLRAIGGRKAIVENTLETGKLAPMIPWSEIVNCLNLTAPIIFDCPADVYPKNIYTFK